MKRTLTALIVSTALTGAIALPTTAQEMLLTGAVAEVFGTQMVVTTPEGRLLVTLPDGTLAPPPGTQVEMTGTRNDQTFIAMTVTVGAAAESTTATATVINTDKNTDMNTDEMMLPVALRGLGLSAVWG